MIGNLFSKKNVLLIFLFTLFFLYAMFLLQGLPFYMYGYDDMDLIYQSSTLSFKKVISLIFLNPLNFEPGFISTGVYQRSVHGFFLKISYAFSRLDPSFYYFLRAIFFSLTGILVYLFVKKITKSEIISIGAGFLYSSLPVIYDGLRYIGAAESFSQFFTLLSIYFFIKLYERKKKYSKIIECSILLIPFMISLFAIKSRETGILSILVFGTFLLLKYKDFRKNKTWFIILLFFMSIYLLPAIFSQFNNFMRETDNSTIEITPQKIGTNIKNFLFYNSETKTGAGEQKPVIFSLKQYLLETPGSVVGSFGFFLSWWLILMLLFYLSEFIKNKFSGGDLQPLNTLPTLYSNNYFLAALIWFFFATLMIASHAGLGDHQAIRYAGEIIIPFILIAIPFSYFITLSFQDKKINYFSKYALTFFLIILFVSIVVNVGVTGINHRGSIGSRHSVMEKTLKTIVQDIYNQAFDNSFLFAVTEHSGDGKIIPCKFSTNISVSDFIVTSDFFLSLNKLITDENINHSLLNYGFVYIISSSRMEANTKYEDMVLLKEINSCEKGYYCDLKNLLKKQKIFYNLFEKQFNKEPKFFVYKIIRTHFFYEKPVKIICNGEVWSSKNG